MHAGLWGLARWGRQELPALPAWCVDIGGEAAAAGLLSALVERDTLRLEVGSVSGLQEHPSTEPEAAVRGDALHVPRLVMPFGARSATALDLPFSEVERLLGSHTADAIGALDLDALTQGYELLEELCQQYVREATASLDAAYGGKGSSGRSLVGKAVSNALSTRLCL